MAMAEFTERRRKEGAAVKGGVVQRDPRIEKAYPALWDYLTTSTTSAGKVRRTTTVLVFVDEGSWKACVNDRDTGEVGFVSSDTAMGLLEALERTLAGDAMEWRASKPYGKGK